MFSVLKINLKCCQNFSTTEILENEDKFAKNWGFFIKSFACWIAQKKNSYATMILIGILSDFFKNAFGILSLPSALLTKFRPEIQKKELSLPSIQFCYIFSYLEKHIVVEFFENSNRNYVRRFRIMYVCAQIYQVDTFKMIVPFLNST